MRSSLLNLIPVALLVLVAAIIGLIYRLALPGLILFDDLGNLRGLAHITDWTSAIDFIVTGAAGPLGRPLALATFAVQAAAWPDDPATLLLTNITIHLLAVGAVYLLAWGLVRMRSPGDESAIVLVALCVAAIWGLSPFLATSTLIIVQRMTSLAGLFTLSGLAAFVWAHLLAPRYPRLGHFLVGLGLGLGTTLATISKENGALLPLLALVILWLWIPKSLYLENLLDRWLIILLGIVPSVALVAYLVFVALPVVVEHGYPQRYFTLADRLMVQPMILLEYLQNLLLPRVSAVTPFTDRYPVAQDWLHPPMTFIAVMFWLGLLGTATWLRRAAPYFLFGLVFFLLGHLLESTFLSLELYFGHRNYLPSFGIYFALVYAATMVPSGYRRIAAAGIAAYALAFAAVLLQVTNGWSQPRVTGEYWLNNNPGSERAAHFLANQYLIAGDFAAAQQVLDQAAERQPRVPFIQLLRTQICVAGEAEFADRLALSVKRLRQAHFEPIAASELMLFTQFDPAALCPGQDYKVLATLADALLENPPYAQSAITKASLLATKGLVAVQEDQTAQAIELLTESFRINPNLDTAFFAASALSNAGREDELLSFLSQVRHAAPATVWKRSIWLRRLDEFVQMMGVKEANAAYSE